MSMGDLESPKKSGGFGGTLYLASFIVFFFVLRTTRPTSITDFGGIGQLSSVHMNIVLRTFIAHVVLNMLKWLQQL
jgi:energy-converting hydrogenase Eha subunit G